MAPPQVDDEYRKQINKAREHLQKIISSNKRYLAPHMLRLALHDAGIYGFQTGTDSYLIKDGPNGSIRTRRESSHPSNKDMLGVLDDCENVKKDNDKITYADLYQLAGVVALQITEGPEIEFIPGREDSEAYPEEYKLPNKKLDESQLKEITKRMGLEEKDMVALIGGLHQWDLPKPELKFDNSYFRELENRESDNPLLKAKFRECAKTCEEGKDKFFKDYAEAHKKVSKRGMREATSSGKEAAKTDDKKATSSGKEAAKTDDKKAASRSRVRLVQGIGIAVVATAIILGFFLSRRSK